jgi:electron transport complex protein RnfB
VTDVAALTERIDAVLPQTQCTRCGYAGCRPYAEAMARGEARGNRCPPGGQPVAEALAALLGLTPEPIDPTCGDVTPPRVAVIDEAECIGCAKCIDACPTDAIAGARKWMHTVIAAECTGCELCIPPCPVDCIVMVPEAGHADRVLDDAEIRARASLYRRRYYARLDRRQRLETEWRTALAARLTGGAPNGGMDP